VDTNSFDLTKFEGLNSNNKNLSVSSLPLNFDALQKVGAFRVTHQGLEGDKYNPDPTAGFSLVSKYNDLIGGDKGTVNWKDNPQAYDVVRNMFMQTPENIGAHKYMQIVESARQLGLKDSDIFLTPQAPTASLQYQDPFKSTIDQGLYGQ